MGAQDGDLALARFHMSKATEDRILMEQGPDYAICGEEAAAGLHAKMTHQAASPGRTSPSQRFALEEGRHKAKVETLR